MLSLQLGLAGHRRPHHPSHVTHGSPLHLARFNRHCPPFPDEEMTRNSVLTWWWVSSGVQDPAFQNPPYHPGPPLKVSGLGPQGSGHTEPS